MPFSKKLRPRLFLEGIEVPVSSISIEATRGAGIVANFELVPTPEVKHLEPRTLVHLMVQDPYQRLDRTVNKKDFDWFLAFEGEYVSKSYGKSSQSRSFTMHCEGLQSTYWESTKAYFMDATLSGNFGTIIGATYTGEGDRVNIKTDSKIRTGTGTTSWLAGKILASLSAGEDISEAIRGIYAQMGVGNAFLRCAEARYRIADKVVSQTAGSLDNLLNEAVLAAVSNTVVGQSESGLSSLRQILLSILQFVFYDIAYLPFPHKTASEIDTPIAGPEGDSTITSVVIKPNVYFAPAPKCNVFFPSMYTNFGHHHNFLIEPTRMSYRPNISATLGASETTVQQKFHFFPKSYRRFMANVSATSDDTLVSAQFLPTDSFGDEYADLVAKNNFGETEKTTSTDGVTNKLVGPVSPKVRDNDFLTNEEAIRGMSRIDVGSIPQADIITRHLSSDNKRLYFDAVAEYIFFKQKLEHRSYTVTMAFNPHPVPGFPCLLIDDSEMDASICGYIEAISHHITTEGAQTNVQVSYAREPLERYRGTLLEPNIPPWFDETLWGSRKTVTTEIDDQEKKKEITKDEADVRRATKPGENSYPNISAIYKGLLGVNSIVLNETTKRTTIPSAVRSLLYNYKKAKEGGDTQEERYIQNYIRRPLTEMKEAFFFIDAVTQGRPDIHSDELIRFVSSNAGARKHQVFDGSFRNEEPGKERESRESIYGEGFGYLDPSRQIAQRMDPVRKYVEELKKSRGQKG